MQCQRGNEKSPFSRHALEKQKKREEKGQEQEEEKDRFTVEISNSVSLIN
jgi:hypothetical protein